MDRFRPELTKFYYDPSRYSTYLEQLGSWGSRDRCWSVTFLGCRRSLDAEGWLDVSGRLLIAWRIPAGA